MTKTPSRKGNPRAALGFRAHSGWAAAVVVAPTHSGVQVIERRRIELGDSSRLGPVQPYHAAERLPIREAEKIVTACSKRAVEMATQAIKEIEGGVLGAGYSLVGCGIGLGSGRLPETLAETLASHPYIHTAEGELFRKALVSASEACGLAVRGVKERDLLECGASELGISVDALSVRLAELGRPMGPPWRQDEKYAALAAWLVLRAA